MAIDTQTPKEILEAADESELPTDKEAVEARRQEAMGEQTEQKTEVSIKPIDVATFGKFIKEEVNDELLEGEAVAIEPNEQTLEKYPFLSPRECLSHGKIKSKETGLTYKFKFGYIEKNDDGKHEVVPNKIEINSSDGKNHTLEETLDNKGLPTKQTHTVNGKLYCQVENHFDEGNKIMMTKQTYFDKSGGVNNSTEILYAPDGKKTTNTVFGAQAKTVTEDRSFLSPGRPGFSRADLFRVEVPLSTEKDTNFSQELNRHKSAFAL